MVFPEDMPVCSPGACMWINTHGSHLNLTVCHCQIFLGLFFLHLADTSPESCQHSSKGPMSLRCSSHCRDQWQSDEMKYQWPDKAVVKICTSSSCSHFAVLLPLTLGVPADIKSRWATYIQTCLQGGTCHRKTYRSHLSWNQSYPKIRSRPKFSIGHVLHAEKLVRKTSSREWASSNQTLHWGNGLSAPKSMGTCALKQLKSWSTGIRNA